MGKMKIILNYDTTSGNIEDDNGAYVGSAAGMEFEPLTEQKNATLELIKNGVTPDEIIKLKNNDLI